MTSGDDDACSKQKVKFKMKLQPCKPFLSSSSFCHQEKFIRFNQRHPDEQSKEQKSVIRQGKGTRRSWEDWKITVCAQLCIVLNDVVFGGSQAIHVCIKYRHKMPFLIGYFVDETLVHDDLYKVQAWFYSILLLIISFDGDADGCKSVKTSLLLLLRGHW